MKALVGILVSLLVGCASKQTMEEFPKKPWYFDGQESAFPDFAQAEPVSELAPEVEEDPSAVMLSSIVDRGDESLVRSFIAGRFLCRQARVMRHEFPCQNVRVAVADRDGRIVHRLQTADGEFVFPAEREKQYYLKVLSHHRAEAGSPFPLKGGEEFVLHLIER